MEAYPRRFIQASLIYFAIGTTLGALMGVDLVNRFAWRFVHIHLNLLGFMTMMVSGVAYHVLPRFSGRPIPYPRFVAWHFWLANLGLVGMTGTRALAAAGVSDVGLRFFPIFGLLAMLGAWLFICNAFLITLRQPEAAPAGRVDGGMKVSEVLARWPATIEVFRRWGFAALSNPAARATFAKLITVEKACRLHRVDAPAFLEALNAAVASGHVALPMLDPAVQAPSPLRCPAVSGATSRAGSAHPPGTSG